MNKAQWVLMIGSWIAIFSGGVIIGRASMNGHVREMKDGWDACVHDAKALLKSDDAIIAAGQGRESAYFRAALKCEAQNSQ